MTTATSTRRVLALLRVSTEAQADESRAGLAAQRAEIERLAVQHALEVVEWVELRGVSGAQVREDPRYRGLLARLAEPDVAGVIVAAFDRLLRRGRFADYAVFDAFADTGSLLWTSQGVIDPRNSSDALLSVLNTEISAQERMKIRERTMIGKEAMRRQGRHVSGYQALPFAVGYDRESRRWYYHPAEAQIVREVFRRVLAGERNFSALARDLGIARTLVHKILRQPLYRGVRRIAYRYPDKRRVPRAPGDVIEQQVLDPPLVDPADWHAAQDALGRPAPTTGASPLPYVGTAVCVRCGRRLSAHSERGRGWTYRCRTGCLQLASRVLDAEADRTVETRLADPGILADAIDAALAAQRSADAVSPEDLQREAKRLLEERERVVVAFERGLRSLTETERRTRELDALLSRVESAREGTEATCIDALALARQVSAPFVGWRLLAPRQKREILQAGVQSLRVERPGRATARVLDVTLRVATAAPRRAVWGDRGGLIVVPCGEEEAHV